LLNGKPMSLANMRSHGRNRVFVCCSNPGCHRNVELDVRGFPNDVTLEICSHACSAQCAIIAAPTLAPRGCIMADLDAGVPALTGSADIKLNTRLSLRAPME